jgi:hypothetical protein
MYAVADWNHPFGQWALKTARLEWTEGVPQLAAIRTYEPEAGRFFEPYGFSLDNQRILFASDVTIEPAFFAPPAFNTQIWTVDAATLGGLKRVSPTIPTIIGPFSNYNEFAYYVPGGGELLFARTVESGAGGMDYWTMSTSGTWTWLTRLTYMNLKGSTQYMGYSVGGGLAFDPLNPKRFVAGVSHELSSNQLEAVFVTMR